MNDIEDADKRRYGRARRYGVGDSELHTVYRHHGDPSHKDIDGNIAIAHRI